MKFIHISLVDVNTGDTSFEHKSLNKGHKSLNKGQKSLNKGQKIIKVLY
jgi:hypothetical protein